VYFCPTLQGGLLHGNWSASRRVRGNQHATSTLIIGHFWRRRRWALAWELAWELVQGKSICYRSHHTPGGSTRDLVFASMVANKAVPACMTGKASVTQPTLSNSSLLTSIDRLQNAEDGWPCRFSLGNPCERETSTDPTSAIGLWPHTAAAEPCRNYSPDTTLLTRLNHK
jgi:hypothetical protein